MTVVVIFSAFTALFLTWHAGRRAGVTHERNKEYKALLAGTWTPKESK